MAKRKTAAQKRAEEEAKGLTGGTEDAGNTAEVTTDAYDFEVGDVEMLKPVALPLIITPKKGEAWKNEAQKEYARILNGYAYRNPAKWETKKATLLSNLSELGSKPNLLVKFMGTAAIGGKLKFKDQRFGEVEGENTGVANTL